MASQLEFRSKDDSFGELMILKSIFQNLAEGIVVADEDGKFIYFNQMAKTILGLGAVDVGPDQWSKVYGCYRSDGITPFPPEELPRARVIAGDDASAAEIFIRNPHRPEGTWITANARPVLDEHGQRRGGVVVLRDIARRKQSELSILTLTSAVEQTADSIVITDRSGLIQYVNPAFEQTTGYTRDEVLGRNPSLLKSGLHDEAFYRKMWGIINSGSTFRATISNRKRCGDIYFAEQTITPMRDASGNITHFVSVVKDVTEQRKLQAQELQMQLARAVQQKLLGAPPPLVAGFDLAGAAFPADATGGDYFDFVPLPEGCIGITIGDVCGHGIGTALLMTELRAFLRAFARRSLDLGEIFTLINTAFVSDLEQDCYATLVVCRLRPASRTLVYASAGHLAGYVLNAEGGVKHVLESINIPLGLLPDRSFQSSGEILLETGDMLILLTDGIVEAERPDGTPFGIDRALDFIRESRHKCAQDIVNGLYHAVREFVEGMPQNDDITAVICKTVECDNHQRKHEST